jgi:hypothetical protein
MRLDSVGGRVRVCQCFVDFGMCIASSDAHVAAFSHNRAVAVEGWAGYEAPRAGVLCQMIHVSVPRVSSFFTCISWPLTTFFFYVQLCRTHLFGATKLHSRNESSNVSRASTQLANVSLKDHWYNLLSLSLSLPHSLSLTHLLTHLLMHAETANMLEEESNSQCYREWATLCTPCASMCSLTRISSRRNSEHASPLFSAQMLS